ncbi:unnamed protein product [Diamesa serratosioi]
MGNAMNKSVLMYCFGKKKDSRDYKSKSTMYKMSPNLTEMDTIIDWSDPNDQWNETIIELVSTARNSKNRGMQFKAVEEIRKITCAKEDLVNLLIKHKAIPLLVEKCKVGNKKTQFQALWALSNITSGTSEQTSMVVKAGSLPILMQLISSRDEDIRMQAIWTLGNIIGDSAELRDLAINQGVIHPILSLSKRKMPLNTKRFLVWTIMNMTRHVEHPLLKSDVAQIVPVLGYLINFNMDLEILHDVIWAFEFLLNNPNNIQMIIESKVTSQIIREMLSVSLEIQRRSLVVITKIVHQSIESLSFNDLSKILERMPYLLKTPNNWIQTDALFLLSSIASGSELRCASILESGILEKVVELLTIGNVDVQEEAIWLINHIALDGNIAQIREITKETILAPLCNLLKLKKKSDVLMVILDTLSTILRRSGSSLEFIKFYIEECGGKDKIKLLISHENLEIVDLAQEMYDRYFAPDYYVEEDINDSDSFVFNVT